MFSRHQILLYVIVITCTQILCVESAGSHRSKNCDKTCRDLLQQVQKNPPTKSSIDIRIGLCKARYRCYKGFKLVGKEIRTCKGGAWIEKKEPKCYANTFKGSCGKPEDIPNAKYTGTSFSFNDRLKYRCEEGYTLIGPRRRRCGAGGKWSKAPRCLRPCGKPEDIPHTKVNGSTYNFEDSLTYSCEKGYALNGPKSRTCGEDAQWSVGPTCTRIKCTHPLKYRKGKLQYGNISSSDPEFFKGTTLVFECNEGYELRGSDTMTCLEFGWTPRRPPYCFVKTCPDPGRPDNGDRFAIGFFKVGRTVRFSCQSGFELHGSRERTCLESKEWSGSLTTCQDGRSDCPVLGTPISGRKYGSKYNNGDIVTFECDPGFVLKGSTVRKCLENGTWNGTEAVCRDEFEDRFKDVNTTAYNFRKNLIDPLLEYTCNSDNATGCNKTKGTGMEIRGRAINLNSDGGLDLVFVIDASSSVKKDTDFKSGLEFAKELVRTIGASKRADGTRIAAVSFGTEARLEFNLGEANVDTMEKAIEAIDKIMYMGGATASALALRMVRRVVVPQARGDSHRVMMFITDGMSNIGGPPQKEAKNLRDEENFEIYAIGVGKKVRIRELMGIASAKEDDDHVISVRKYKTLQEAIKKAVDIKIDYSPCGVSPVDFRARMVNGKNSKRGWWPWQIGLYKNNDGGLQLICGGALISHRWILTAAHCFYHFSPIFGKYRFRGNTGEYKVRVGDHNLERDERSQQEIAPEKFFVHQDYVDRKFVNDIALIKLEEEVELSPFVRTLCLPEKDEGDLAIPMKYGFATGWGVTQALRHGEDPEPENRYSKRLQYSTYTIQSDELCANRSAIAINSTVAFCTGDGKGGNDTCHGDSGGAFVREGKRGEDYRWVATGLVSWGLGCAQKNEYGYYTRVYPFTDWIKNTIKENTEADD